MFITSTTFHRVKLGTNFFIYFSRTKSHLLNLSIDKRCFHILHLLFERSEQRSVRNSEVKWIVKWFTNLQAFIEWGRVEGCYGSKQSTTCNEASDMESVKGGGAPLIRISTSPNCPMTWQVALNLLRLDHVSRVMAWTKSYTFNHWGSIQTNIDRIGVYHILAQLCVISLIPDESMSSYLELIFS